MIKFTAANRPPFVLIRIKTAPPHPDGLTFGDFVQFAAGDDRLEEGDYIIQDADGIPIGIIRAAAAAAQAERIEAELGRDLKATIRQAIKNLNLTSAEKADLVNRILAVYVLIDDGDLRAARFQANATATGGAYTAGRRNQLVALIDDAIQSLPA